MEVLNDLLKNEIFSRVITSMVLIICSFIIYNIVTKIIVGAVEKGRFHTLLGKKVKTYIRLIRNINRYIFIIGTLVLILQANGINISSIVAGVGIVGVVVGLAIQDWLKDIIRGSSILSDNYFAVGDVVKYKDIEGKVLILGLKTTKIQDLKTSNILSIANRNIDEIQVLSNIIYVNVPMPYELSVEKAESVISDVMKKAEEYDNIKKCEYVGVSELADSCIKYKIRVTCNPQEKLQVERNTLRSILVVFEENKVEVPYTQIDIHQK